MKKILIAVLMVMLAGCSGSDAKINELQSKIDELSLIIENQKSDVKKLANKNVELTEDLESLLRADVFGGVKEKYEKYYDINVVNGAVNLEKLNTPNEKMKQDLVGIYTGLDSGNTIVLQIYPSGVVVLLSTTSNGSQVSYDGEYRENKGVGTFHISYMNPGITYTDVTYDNGLLKMSTCDGICSPQDDIRKIELKKLK